MVWLLLSMSCSVILGFLFKVFPKYGIDTFQAIVVNYMVCVACSTLQNRHFMVDNQAMQAPWLPYALCLGFVFITGFTLAAATVRHFSVTISQIMQKMSILITVPFAIIAYHESAGWMKVLGVVLAIIAIVLVNIPEKAVGADQNDKKAAISYRYLAIPFFTWLLAGVIEVVFVIVQKGKMIAMGDTAFITTVFFTAGCLGTLYLVYQIVTGTQVWSNRSIVAGLALGIPNYGSMFFLLQGLSSGIESSIFFPLNNMGIILLTALIAVLVFKDRLSKINLFGILLTLIALYFLNV
jgi:drug/metabolite transporter (DMT)-like permease